MSKRSVALASLALALIGCDNPPEDTFINQGGGQPEPSGALEGSVMYVGPRPLCTWKNGKATEARGVVVMTMFNYDNPVAPEGGANGAVSFATVSAQRLFPDLKVCLPESPSEQDYADTVTSTATFVWSGLPLGYECNAEGKRQDVSYRMTAVFDRDSNYHPLFSVRNQPTRGDVMGGAYEHPDATQVGSPVDGAGIQRDTDIKLRRITFRHRDDALQGQLIGGVVVTVSERVHTEQPISRIKLGTPPMSSESTLDLSLVLSDSPGRLAKVFPVAASAQGLVLELIPDSDQPRYQRAFDIIGTRPNYELSGYTWHHERFSSRRVDPDTGEITYKNTHPVIPTLPYYTPATFFNRARTRAEINAGVPDILLLGATYPAAGATEDSNELPVLVPPVAIMNLPGPAECQIPMFAPETSSFVLEATPSFLCGEVPTGEYNLTVIQGMRGGELLAPGAAVGRFDVPDATGRCQGGDGLACARNSFQVWAIPNELGPPDLKYNPDAVDQLRQNGKQDPAWISEQGPEGRYRVEDPNPANNDPGDSNCAGEPAVSLSCECCASIAKLCAEELPLCQYENGVAVVTNDKNGKLTCLPFPLPRSCCDGTCDPTPTGTPSKDFCPAD